MRRTLVISSFVSKGSVGLQATLPALTAASIGIIAIPTIVLSNHPGFEATAGIAIASEILHAILDAHAANGWLADVDAVFTGYLPSVAHVQFAISAIERVKSANPKAICLVDPVIGDDPGGLYVDREIAIAIRDALLPLADITTPNRFELSWLSGDDVSDRVSAQTAASKLGIPLTAVTSVPEAANKLDNVLFSSDGAFVETVDRVQGAPHGTGDYFAGALLAELLNGSNEARALTHATRLTERVLLASRHSSDLVFAES